MSLEIFISAHGPVTVNRAVDIIGKPVRLSILTDFDKEAISYAIGRGCKEVYASFASSKFDVLKVREYINDKNVQIIAKIESAKGLANAKISFSHLTKFLLIEEI